MLMQKVAKELLSCVHLPAVRARILVLPLFIPSPGRLPVLQPVVCDRTAQAPCMLLLHPPASSCSRIHQLWTVHDLL